MPPPGPFRPVLATLWKTLLASAAGYWLGGTLFYITVVIHTAHRVFGSQREVGFVTRQVTRQLNAVGVAVVLLLLVNLLIGSAVARRGAISRPVPRPRARRRVLLTSWLALAALHAGLLLLHPQLDRHLDPQSQRIHDRPAFRRLHNAYMAVTTLQLAAGLLQLTAALTPRQPSPDPATA